MKLLTSPRAGRTVRALLGTISDAVRSVAAPAALVTAKAATTTAVESVETSAPTVFSADEMPTPAAIAAAALGYDLASDNARSADRAKRKHRKLLDRLPGDGVYGQWLIRRVPSSKQTPDMVAIRAIFEAHGLGLVPMRTVAASLRVERIEVPADVDTAAPAAELVAA